MASFFAPLFEKIQAKVKELLEQAKAKKAPANFIFMVGGFSENPYLKSEIKKTFETPELQVNLLCGLSHKLIPHLGACTTTTTGLCNSWSMHVWSKS